jgi:hypothetical protein
MAAMLWTSWATMVYTSWRPHLLDNRTRCYGTYYVFGCCCCHFDSSNAIFFFLDFFNSARDGSRMLNFDRFWSKNECWPWRIVIWKAILVSGLRFIVASSHVADGMIGHRLIFDRARGTFLLFVQPFSSTPFFIRANPHFSLLCIFFILSATLIYT